MASDVSKYVSLKRVISYFLDECSLPADELDKSWILSFRGLVLLNQSIAAEPKTLRLPKNGNQTVTLPSDYLSWSKIGVMDSGGKVSTLKVNNALTTYKDANPDRLSRLTPDVNNSLPLLANSPFFYNYGYNGVYQTLFGIGTGLVQYGECRVDEVNNLVILNPEFKYDSILLEYISSPQNDGDYEIPIVLQEALIAFLKWKYKMGSREEFYGAATEGRRSLPKKKVTLQDLAQVIRENDSQSLRS